METEVKPTEPITTIEQVAEVIKKPEGRGRPPTCLKCGHFHKTEKPCKEPPRHDMIAKAVARQAKQEQESKPVV
jgi:hypothetical protein